jgi:hypothetical protein
LHGFSRSKPQGGIIEQVVGQVGNEAGTAAALRYDTGGTEAEAWKLFGPGVREHNPLGFLHKVGEFFLEEDMLVIATFVGPTVEGLFEPSGRPFRGAENGGGSHRSESFKEWPGGVSDG